MIFDTQHMVRLANLLERVAHERASAFEWNPMPDTGRCIDLLENAWEYAEQHRQHAMDTLDQLRKERPKTERRISHGNRH